MGLEARHPLYDAYSPEWITMRDLWNGERTVKEKGETYLPATESMRIDGMGSSASGTPKDGQAAYDAYKLRAVFPEYVQEAVAALVGMMHKKPPVIEVPAKMEPLLKKATLTGEGLEDVLRTLNSEQLLTGRVGVLADLPAEVKQENAATVLPYLAIYQTETITNWDSAALEEGFSALNMVVLNETGMVRESDFTWKEKKKFRLLQLGELLKNESVGAYSFGVFTDDAIGSMPTKENMKEPSYFGKTLNEIPFVFINCKDIVTTPDKPPLSGLGKLCLAIYRGDADYRQNLFMQGQDTLVIIGGTAAPVDPSKPADSEAVRVGAGSRIDCDIGGDAKMVGVSGKGLTEQREALNKLHADAQSMAGKLIPPKNGDAESGEALKTRITAQTATLTEIAKSGAKGLENILKVIAKWIGEDPEKVSVKPNLEFGDLVFNAREIVELMTARSMGAPISRQSIHGVLIDRGLTKMSFEDELEVIDEENRQLPPAPGTVGGPHPRLDPNDLSDDDEDDENE